MAVWLGAGEFRVATYNVENLFDLHYSGTEYSDYIPNTSTQYNRKTYRAKLANIAQVIVDMKPDMLALQEVESAQALRDLQTALRNKGHAMQYSVIASKKKSSVHNALLSRFPIEGHREISVNAYDNLRAILEVDVRIRGEVLTIFVNHWKAKSGPESQRIPYAKALAQRLKTLPKERAYLIVGDLNSDVEEYVRFVKKHKHNDTNGITGINHILRTIDAQGLIDTARFGHLDPSYHLNLWSTLAPKERYSHIYKGTKEALDHIIINRTLWKGKHFSYVEGSFARFAPDYLYKGKDPYRWQMTQTIPAHFTGQGYSDHLPLFADFVRD
ncbi:MAG: hypothetical protein KU37_09315 [Sulfuricurvum sp. PC08-66]|nr:MAG: hypothetical protein KU37_09315 [Sulfuricurvum sp. PC08-66]